MTSPAATTPGIVAFIEARLDEDEQWAMATAGPLYSDAEPGTPAHSERLLAATAMRRAILALHRAINAEERKANYDAIVGCEVCSWRSDDDSLQVEYPCQTVRLLAAIDADHPDYDASWKPVAG